MIISLYGENVNSFLEKFVGIFHTICAEDCAKEYVKEYSEDCAKEYAKEYSEDCAES